LTYRTRKATDGERFEGVMQGIAGKRLTYDKLVGKDAVVAPA